MFADPRYPIEEPPAPGTTIEVAPGVKWLQMPLPFSLNHINLYLIEDGEGWAIVDTGIRDEGVQEIWQEIFDKEMDGKPVTKVIATHMHPDHLGNAGWICRKWDVEFYISRTEFYHSRGISGAHVGAFPDEAMRFYYRGGLAQQTMDEIAERGFGNYGEIVETLPMSYRRLMDGDVLELGGKPWKIITGSGHSPEHVCLYCEERDILISGDQVLPRITSNVSVHPMEPEENPLKFWLASHRKFLNELPETAFVLPAHNRPFYGLHDRLNFLIHHHEDRMQALMETCVEPKKASDLLDVLFERELDSFQMMLAIGECYAHLHCLMERNRMTRFLGEDGIYRFQCTDHSRALHETRVEHDKRDPEPMMV